MRTDRRVSLLGKTQSLFARVDSLLLIVGN